MKKKIFALMLCIAMLAIAVVGGTMAYFMDTDAQVNTMTVGNVKIEQYERERAADGSLQTFAQNKPLVPSAVAPAYGSTIEVGGQTISMFVDEMNAVDKIVNVKNTGASDAYIRTIIALEVPNAEVSNCLGINTGHVPNTEEPYTYTWYTDGIVVDGVNYEVCVFTYKDKLAPDTESKASLTQVYLTTDATNETVEALGGDFTILALSQAVQADGFDTAAAAFSAAYDNNAAAPAAADLIAWLGEVVA